MDIDVSPAWVGRFSYLQLPLILTSMASTIAIPTGNHSNTMTNFTPQTDIMSTSYPNLMVPTDATLLSEENSQQAVLNESTNATLLSEGNSTQSALNITSETNKWANSTTSKVSQEEAQRDLWKGVREDDGLLIERAFSSGADLEARDRIGWTPLTLAVASDHGKAVATLIRLGADVERTDERAYKWTPLSWAATDGRIQLMDQLIAAGAKLETPDGSGWTPLISAAFNGHLDAVKHLVKLGANVTAENNYEYTAIQKAAIGGHQDVVDYLRSVGGCGKPPGCRWLDTPWEKLINP